MLIPLMLGAAVAAAPPQQGTQKVRVDGALYRVTVQGDRFEVARKTLISTVSTEERDRMFRALEAVTGCKANRDWMAGNILMGKLDCSHDSATSAPPAKR